MEVMNNTPFLAFTRIALNNWHYISRKVLSLNREINFFTGHSGSGKSTVIDAMQLVLYANTDGRGFFNKAAADDSDRSLIEYLRGMVNIGENNEFSYLRNQNFSSTIVLEMQLTGTENFQCIGIVFDVNTASNEVQDVSSGTRDLYGKMNTAQKPVPCPSVKWNAGWIPIMERKSIFPPPIMRGFAGSCMRRIWEDLTARSFLCFLNGRSPFG